MPEQDLRDDFQGHSTSARERRGISAEVMRAQGQAHLGRCPPDEGSGPGVAKPEESVSRSKPLLRHIPLEPLRNPYRHEGRLRLPTLGGQQEQPAPFDTGDREAEDFPDPQSTSGLQLQEQSSPEGCRPVDQFIDSVAVEARPEWRSRGTKGLAQQGALAGVRDCEFGPFDHKGEERCDLRVAEPGRTGGSVSGQGLQKSIDLLTRQGFKLSLPERLQIFLGAGHSS